MKKIGMIIFGCICALAFGIHTWAEGSLSAATEVSVSGAIVMVKNGDRWEPLPDTSQWHLWSDPIPDVNAISKMHFTEYSGGLFGGEVEYNSPKNFLTSSADGSIPANEYYIRVDKLYDMYGMMINSPNEIIAPINVANNIKADAGYTIELSPSETKLPTGYGELTCWTSDTSKCALEYDSSNESIITVSSTGEITAIAQGEADVNLKLKTQYDSYILEAIPVHVVNVSEPQIEFTYQPLLPELIEGEMQDPVEIGTLAYTPADGDLSAYTFEIDGSSYITIQNASVQISKDAPADTYSYSVVVKKAEVEVYRSASSTIQIQEPVIEPNPDPVPDPDPSPTPDPDPDPVITFTYTATITSLTEGYLAQQIGSILPSAQGVYYYEAADETPIVSVRTDGSVSILPNHPVGTYPYTISVYADITKTSHLQDVTGTITISEATGTEPEEEAFQFLYNGAAQTPNTVLLRTYDPQANMFTLTTNKLDIHTQSLNEDVITIQGSNATIHKANEEGVYLQTVYNDQTYKIKMKIMKALQEPVSFASDEIELAYGTLSYDPVFSGGSGTGDYVLTSSDPLKIKVSPTSPSTLVLQESATGEVTISVMRKGDENYKDSIVATMSVCIRSENDAGNPELTPDPTPEPTPDPDPNPDQPGDEPSDEETKKTISSSEKEGTLTYNPGFPKQANFRIEDVTATSKQEEAITKLNGTPSLILRLSLTNATLHEPAQIHIPLDASIANPEACIYYYEKADGTFLEIHPVIKQNELQFSSDYMGKLVIVQAKEEDQKKPNPTPDPDKKDPSPSPTPETPDDEQKPTDQNQTSGSQTEEEDNNQTLPNQQNTVTNQGVLTGDTTNLLLLANVVIITSILLVMLLRRRNIE